MFDDICKQIISPPKFKYSMYDLGSSIGKYGKRKDFVVYNYKNKKMNCSYYQPHKIVYQRASVIYLHSMNGSRLQSSIYVESILKLGISFCCFDFSGCGNSQGQKISFGANQKYDVEVVINKLKSDFYLNRFVLWGRSMGSVCAIKYAELIYDKYKTREYYQKEEIMGLVLDSSFKSLSQLLIQIGSSHSEIPSILIKLGYYIIKKNIEQKGQFKISDLDLISSQQTHQQRSRHKKLSPLSKLSLINIPILFLTSKQDKTVNCQHSIDMYNSYQSELKEIKYFKGLHNQSRDEEYLSYVIGFIENIFRKVQEESRSEERKLIKQYSQRNIYHSLSRKQVNEDLFFSNRASPRANDLLNMEKSNVNNNKPHLQYKRSVVKLIEQQHKNQQIQQRKFNINFQSDDFNQSGCMCNFFQNQYKQSHPNQNRNYESIQHYTAANNISSSHQTNHLNPQTKRSIKCNIPTFLQKKQFQSQQQQNIKKYTDFNKKQSYESYHGPKKQNQQIKLTYTKRSIENQEQLKSNLNIQSKKTIKSESQILRELYTQVKINQSEMISLNRVVVENRK